MRIIIIWIFRTPTQHRNFFFEADVHFVNIKGMKELNTENKTDNLCSLFIKHFGAWESFVCYGYFTVGFFGGSSYYLTLYSFSLHS